MEPLLTTEHLKKYYGRKNVIKAVDDVSLTIHKGASLGLIGESGSGKTTFGKLVAGLEKATEGAFSFKGQAMENLTEKEFRPYRKNLQMVFQSSGGVFDPSYTIGDSIQEVLKNFEKLSKAEYQERIEDALASVGLDPMLKNRYVGQLSGGQCQRANIARALILRPELVICDEPVSSLDYSIRKQILNLLANLQDQYDMTYLLITHDLSNVPYLCNAVAIMYKGRIVEYLDRTDRIRESAVHPYTNRLFASIPATEPKLRTIGKRGFQSSLDEIQLKQGCPYQNLCPLCKAVCKEVIPELQEIEPGHKVACHLYK